MKILFVAMPFSIHTVRWINQLESLGWEIHFFSSYPYTDAHPMLKGVFYHDYFHTIKNFNPNIVYVPILPFELKTNNKIYKQIFGKVCRVLKLEDSREKTLQKVIKKVKPNIIHSLETQAAGYLVSKVNEINKLNAKWIHSIWGIDLHFFGKIDEHIPKIKRVLQNIDVFISEGIRDVEIAKEFNFSKKSYILPAGGGHNVNNVVLKNFTLTSKRKLILLKGTQDICRRGLVGLRALERCAEILHPFEIIIYNCAEEVRIAAAFFQKKYNNIKITILNEASHSEMLLLNQNARISITTNLSDGMPNSVIEAMLFGAFPIQSNTSNANEWIDNGKTGFLVQPEDSDVIENAIRKALQEDELVNNAAQINHKKIKALLNYDEIKSKVIDMYKNELEK